MESNGLAYFVWMVISALIALVFVVRMRRRRASSSPAPGLLPSPRTDAAVLGAAGLAFLGLIALALIPAASGLILQSEGENAIAALLHVVLIAGLVALLLVAIGCVPRALAGARPVRTDDDLFEEGGIDETDH